MSYEAWGEPDEDRFEAARDAGWIDPTDQSKALIDVMNERARQWDGEGFSHDHDDQVNAEGGLIGAAICYALEARGWRNEGDMSRLWPWDRGWWKPSGGSWREPLKGRRDLVKAAALLLAEIERLDRLEAKGESHDAG